MGCFQTQEVDNVIEDDSLTIQDKLSSIKIGNEVPKTLSSSADLNDKKIKVTSKPSEVLVLAPELTAELLTTYQRPVNKAMMKDIKIHIDRNIKYYMQLPAAYLYISGNLAPRYGSGFEDKLEQRLSEGIGMIDNELKRRGIGYACKKGAKSAPNQDDFFILIDGEVTILGVFDGHGLFGHYCSYVVQQLFPKLLLSNKNYKDNLEIALKESFLMVDEAIRGIAVQEGKFSADVSGTTVTIAVHRGNKLFIAHVGDSRAILSKMNADGKVIAVKMTHDHSPDNSEEKKRIEQNGGEVRKEGIDSPARVFCLDANYPGLAMSRAIGDTVAKSFGVIAEPEVSVHNVEYTDNFLILATDGVWEFLEEQDIANMIYLNGKQRADKSALNIAEYAFSIWLEQEDNTTDDITCIVYYLN